MNDFPPIKVLRKTGNETFIGLDKEETLSLNGFWQWSASDLISNATRGVLAEYLVAVALELDQGVRSEWDAYDLETEDGVKIEVKSSAYIQSWYQCKLSQIIFSIRPTFAWDFKTNLQAKEKKRQADIYVFCLLHHKDQNTINPMDMSQWIFYVISTKQLESACFERKSITLKKLKSLAPKECTFSNLNVAISSTRV